jgi:hypothetical protein
LGAVGWIVSARAGESVSHVREVLTKVESGRRQRWARQAVGSWQHGLQIAMHRDGGWIERSAGKRASGQATKLCRTVGE